MAVAIKVMCSNYVMLFIKTHKMSEIQDLQPNQIIKSAFSWSNKSPTYLLESKQYKVIHLHHAPVFYGALITI